jgi:hypothetical protein
MTHGTMIIIRDSEYPEVIYNAMFTADPGIAMRLASESAGPYVTVETRPETLKD